MNEINNRKKIIITGLLLFILLTIIYIVIGINKKPVEPTIDHDMGKDQLNFSSYLFTISGPEDSTFNVVAGIGRRTAALKKIIGSGIDPTSYRINFNYENPFKEYE